MKDLFILFSLAILVLFLAFAVKLRTWIRSMRRDIYEIRDEVRSLKKHEEAMGDLIGNMTAEGVNASCINALGFRFPVFMGGPSIDTHHARNLVFLLQERRPRTILELGSGSSTIIIARTLQLMGASPDLHISVDHDARFLGNTQELARLNGVAELVQFEHCPLSAVDGFPTPWYSRIVELAKSSRFDFVLVDGPPAYAKGEDRAREPALTMLRPYLSENAILILDDANRPGEQDVVTAWLDRYPEFNLYEAKEGKGIAILSLGAN